MQVSATAPASVTTSAMAELDPAKQKDMFLRLLVAQLKNQDPLSPTEDKEFLGQMAQFSAVEQMSNVAKTLQSMQSSSAFTQGVALIGKQVEYIDENGVGTATVTALSQNQGIVKLMLDNGSSIQVSDVVTVS